MANQAAIVRRVAEEVFKEKGVKVDYMVGTMIELPRAAWWRTRSPRKPSSSASAPTTSRRRPSASRATTSTSSCRPISPKGIIKQDPFAVLDQEGVGQLVKMGTERGRKTRPESEGRHLRRARRRTLVGRVLRTEWVQLCFLLAVPRVDGAFGGGAGRRQRSLESGGRTHEVSRKKKEGVKPRSRISR